MNLSRRQWLPWLSVSVLALSCATLGYLQYRWTGQITEAERTSLYQGLRGHLSTLTRALNDEISSALAALQPPPGQVEMLGRTEAYGAQYSRWAQTHAMVFRRIGLAVPRPDGDLTLFNLDMATGRFSPAEWPTNWDPMRGRLSR
ncbi:MAG: hypothetical protein M3N54_09295, partial [Acidobacteriota bacterium]|nr:hypothetical protein [Acidobacteriota bacterium]